MTPRQAALELDGTEPLLAPAPRRTRGIKREGPEDLFAMQCRAAMLPAFERQYVFAEDIGRRWRFDFAFPDYWLAVEIEGLAVRRLAGQLVVMGRHASIQGIKDDMEKYNTAALLGWTVLRFDQQAVGPKRALAMTMRVLQARGWKVPQ